MIFLTALIIGGYMRILLIALVVVMTFTFVYNTEAAECEVKGIRLQGRVMVDNAFPDLKVQIVEGYADLDVKLVDAFPDRCGEWQMVTRFPDFTVQFVNTYPDMTIEYVRAFPGMRKKAIR
jgi:hypothetical protein